MLQIWYTIHVSLRKLDIGSKSKKNRNHLKNTNGRIKIVIYGLNCLDRDKVLKNEFGNGEYVIGLL